MNANDMRAAPGERESGVVESGPWPNRRQFVGTASALVAAGIGPPEWFPREGERDARGRVVRSRRLVVNGRLVVVRERTGSGSARRFEVFIYSTQTEREQEQRAERLAQASRQAEREAERLAQLTPEDRRLQAAYVVNLHLAAALHVIGEASGGYRYARAEVERVGRLAAEILLCVERGELLHSADDLRDEQARLAAKLTHAARLQSAQADTAFQVMLMQCRSSPPPGGGERDARGGVS